MIVVRRASDSVNSMFQSQNKRIIDRTSNFSESMNKALAAERTKFLNILIVFSI